MDSELKEDSGFKGVFPGTANNQKDSNLSALESVESKQNSGVTNDSKTYIKLETKNSQGQLSGVLEIDLISFREKGQESRYLSINTLGSDSIGESSNTIISIDNELDFNRFKKFISELNWND